LQYLTFAFTPDSIYEIETFAAKLPEGFLLNASAYTTGSMAFQTSGTPAFPLPGQTWVQLMIVAPVQPNVWTGTFLTQGYITAQERISYPARQGTSTIREGYPFMRFGSVISGIGLAYTVPQHAVDEITGVSFTYQTSAAVGSRSVYLAFQSSLGTVGTIRNIIVPFTTPQAAGTTVNYEAWILAPSVSVPAVGTFQTLPLRQIMRAGQYLIPGVSGGDAADVDSNLTVWGNEWLVP
jgi:hypothetical protein